ncbi:hypothetical protein [Geitlerinema calcuttense]|uniref:Uncharacterized protein n=1 Tax=Geitlerinema calcuttense NRMC-F 0142 TaxID=2922238 RepID=A0ABT7LYZ5_9CYAN|nr:hypothetical protein [Geitlerinema calcuttense]MDL5057231.1 hypothetical protein [Geitlerinema calcuttense NRMC-F 0142]
MAPEWVKVEALQWLSVKLWVLALQWVSVKSWVLALQWVVGENCGFWRCNGCG